MIKTITFDLDGVYFINGKSNFIASLEKLGVSEGEAKKVFLKSDEMNKFYKTGKMTDEEYWSWAIKEWKIDLTVNQVIKLLINGYESNQEVLDVLRRVKNNGYKTLVCSNNFPARVKGLDDRFHFLDDFDGTVSSYQVRATKPSEDIFLELVKRSEVKPEEIVFADDNEDNLEGARKIRIEAFFYEGFDKFVNKLKELGVKI